jgi:hypothetical protein
MMVLRLVQFTTKEGARQVASLNTDGTAQIIEGISSTYALARKAIADHASLEVTAKALGLGTTVNIHQALAEGRVLAPLDHPDDPAHLIVTGTGLTHLGSAEGRNAMHKKLTGKDELTDSMRMFKMGLEGGKPRPGQEGVQPEWFYKGDGSSVIAPEAPFRSPAFADDGGEEPEIAGLYIIAADGTVCRLGFALGNEFSDHLMEKVNYLWLAHSKLRPCSFGPELLTGDLPATISGASRIHRGNTTVFDQPFVSGEDNMSHTIANLEHHHFKYDDFRRPGDVHVHFFGTATLSFSAGVKTRKGDIFEIEADAFVLRLRNRLEIASPAPESVRTL